MPVPAAIRAALAGQSATLADPGSALRRVAEDAYHITVHFFGPLSGDSLASAYAVAGAPELVSTPAIACRLSGLGQFPRGGAARVVIAELADGRDALVALVKQARQLVRAAGLQVEQRSPHPHVTVARVRRGQRWQLPAQTDWSSPGFVLEHLVLFESRTGPGGARYHPLASYTLAGRR